MTAFSCLSTLFHQHLVDTEAAEPLDNLVDAYLNEGRAETELLQKVVEEECSHKAAAFSESASQSVSLWEVVEKWRKLLTIILIAKDLNILHLFQKSLSDQMQKLSTITLWREFQLWSVYHHLVCLLLSQSSATGLQLGSSDFSFSKKEVEIFQGASGASPLEGGHHWFWGEIPNPVFHAELGMLWALYTVLKKDEKVKLHVEKLSLWQLNTLDSDFLPFAGLYSQESDASLLSLLMNNHVLFDVASRLCKRSELAHVAEQQIERLAALMLLPPGPIPIHALVLKIWFGRHLPPQEVKSQEAKSFELTSTIQDRSLALIGYRSPKNKSASVSGIATLYGGLSGMGCFHKGDVQIVNFGPQHLPLGDCTGFGLEGTEKLLSGRLQTFETRETGFILEGVARMAPRPKDFKSFGTYRHGDPSGCWIDTKIEMENDRLSLAISYNGIFDDSLFAFVFFVKALGCIVDGRQQIKAKSFQNYQGNICSAHFQGESSSIAISIEEGRQKEGEMRVVPLGGGQNFWGADYLIAYQCRPNAGRYRWQLV